LDTMTFGGGLGCALLWPFSLHRFWAPVRFIPVAPIGLDLLSAWGLRVTAAEIVLFAPFWLYALWALWLRPAAEADASRARPPLPWRALASLVLLLHAAAGGLVLWALPQGFPVAHWRWIANTALPVGGGVTALYAVVAGWQGRDGPRRLLLSALCGGWAGAALTGWLLFPLSSSPEGAWIGLSLAETGALVLAPTSRYGEVAVTYQVTPAPNGSRLVVKIASRLCLRLLHALLAVGDLVMMRKQLLTLKELAEHEVGTSSRLG